MPGITIRRATPQDAMEVHGLLTRLEASLDAGDRVQRQADDIVRYGFSGTPLFHALIAWQGEQPVGLALYFPEFSTWRGRPGVYVQDLFVSAKLRGTGLGRQLMEAVFDEARVWGADYCKLGVYDDNHGAMAFYEKLGFKVAANERTLMLNKLS